MVDTPANDTLTIIGTPPVTPSLAQVLAAANQPLNRADRLALARIQAATGLEAIRTGDVSAAKAFLVDALDHLDRARSAE